MGVKFSLRHTTSRAKLSVYKLLIYGSFYRPLQGLDYIELGHVLLGLPDAQHVKRSQLFSFHLYQLLRIL